MSRRCKFSQKRKGLDLSLFCPGNRGKEEGKENYGYATLSSQDWHQDRILWNFIKRLHIKIIFIFIIESLKSFHFKFLCFKMLLQNSRVLKCKTRQLCMKVWTCSLMRPGDIRLIANVNLGKDGSTPLQAVHSEQWNSKHLLMLSRSTSRLNPDEGENSACFVWIVSGLDDTSTAHLRFASCHRPVSPTGGVVSLRWGDRMVRNEQIFQVWMASSGCLPSGRSRNRLFYQGKRRDRAGRWHQGRVESHGSRPAFPLIIKTPRC